MFHIRTADDMARALDSPLDPELKQLLRDHAERLAEYDDYGLEEMAEFLIVEAGDTVELLQITRDQPILTPEATDFAHPVELITRHQHWIEAVFILSDDGFGLVLLVEQSGNADAALLTVCNRHLEQPTPSAR
jgi:hypothetical protein